MFLEEELMKAVSQYDIETTNNNENSRLKSYLKCSFPINPHVRLLVCPKKADKSLLLENFKNVTFKAS